MSTTKNIIKSNFRRVVFTGAALAMLVSAGIAVNTNGAFAHGDDHAHTFVTEAEAGVPVTHQEYKRMGNHYADDDWATSRDGFVYGQGYMTRDVTEYPSGYTRTGDPRTPRVWAVQNGKEQSYDGIVLYSAYDTEQLEDSYGMVPHIYLAGGPNGKPVAEIRVGPSRSSRFSFRYGGLFHDYRDPATMEITRWTRADGGTPSLAHSEDEYTDYIGHGF